MKLRAGYHSSSSPSSSEILSAPWEFCWTAWRAGDPEGNKNSFCHNKSHRVSSLPATVIYIQVPTVTGSSFPALRLWNPRIWSSWQLSLSVILSVSRAEIQFISGGDSHHSHHSHHYHPANQQRKLNQLPEGSLPNWIFTLPISLNNLSKMCI